MPHSRRRSRSSSRHRRRRHGRDHRRRLDEPRGRRGYPSDSDSDYSSDYYSSFTSSSSDEGDVAAALYERERRKRRKIEKRMRELETMYLKEKVLRDIAPFAKDKPKEKEDDKRRDPSSSKRDPSPYSSSSSSSSDEENEPSSYHQVPRPAGERSPDPSPKHRKHRRPTTHRASEGRRQDEDFEFEDVYEPLVPRARVGREEPEKKKSKRKTASRTKKKPSKSKPAGVKIVDDDDDDDEEKRPRPAIKKSATPSVPFKINFKLPPSVPQPAKSAPSSSAAKFDFAKLKGK